MSETENCKIKKVSIDCERGCTFWVHLEYGCGGQAFGGIICGGDLLQRFIKALCEAFGVLCWEDLSGLPARAVHTHTKVQKLGHFIDDKWVDVDLIIADWKKARNELEGASRE